MAMTEREALEVRYAKLRADIMSLSPSERVRLAAELMEARQSKMALAVLRGIVADLTTLDEAGALG